MRLRVTVDQVMAWNPCDRYAKDRVLDLFGGREALAVEDVVKLHIPTADRIWALCHEELVPAMVLHEFACQCAERTLMLELEAGREPDERSWHAVHVKRQWMRGEATDMELTAARAAAHSAAWDAARAASWDAAWAAEDSAEAAAWAEAGDSASDAAWAAASAAYRDAARAALGAASWAASWDAARAAPRAWFPKTLMTLSAGGDERTWQLLCIMNLCRRGGA